MRLHVDEVQAPGTGPPLLLHFQNGYVTEEFNSSSSHAKLLSDGERTVVAAEIEGALYAGEAEQDELGKTLLLVRNKTTGKVRVMEVGSASLRAVVHTAALSQDEEVNNLDVSRKFGSKRDKKRMEQREKLKMNTETMVDQLKNVAETTNATDIDLKTYTTTNAEDYYIPPINRDAANVKDVYEVGNILNEEQVEKIASEIESKDYNSELLPYLKTFAEKGRSDTEVALLLYANSLLKMFSSNIRDISKKVYTVCETSHTLNEICCDKFTLMVNGKRSRSNQYKDKTLCHLIVIILLLNNYRFDLNAFATAVKLSPSTIITKTQVVGAHISSDKKTVTLKLPLNTAKSFMSRRKSAKF